MGRVSQEEIERLKAEVTLQKVLEGRGLELVKHGAKDLACLCPLHEEQTPSFVVTPEKALWKCFGCGKGGDLLSLVQVLEGVSFRQAVELLRAGYPATGAALGAAGTKKSTIPKLPCPLKEEASAEELLSQVMDYYHETLTERGSEAVAYLKKRGISEEAIAYFHLGYADRTLGYRLPAKTRRAGAELRGKLQELGIIRESGHELFSGSLVAPIFDERGRVVHAYGRKTNDNLREGTKYHLNLDGQLKGLFNIRALSSSTEIILCEAIFDALAFWSAGFRNVVATRGAGAFTAENLEAFIRHGIKRVWLAFDADAAGDDGAAQVGALLLEEGMECLRVEFPRGMDANSFALAHVPARMSLGRLLELAQVLPVRSRSGPASRTTPPSGEDAAPLNPATMESALDEELPKNAGRKVGPSTVLIKNSGTGSGLLEELPKNAGVPSSPKEEPSIPAEAQARPEAHLPKRPERPQAQGSGWAQQDADPEPSPVPPLVAQAAARPGEAQAPKPKAQPGKKPEQEPLLDYRVKGDEVQFWRENRCWRVRGIPSNASSDRLQVSLHCSRGELFHLDRGDLNSARWRGAFVKQAAVELGVEEHSIKADLGRVFTLLEELHEKSLQETLTPKQAAPKMTEQEVEEALCFLKDPRLFERILEDYETIGVVGEETNKLFGYVAATSRKLPEPLAIIVQSATAAGKTALMDAVLCFMPEEDRVKYSAMTGQSLFYMGETDLKYKILAIVEEAGAQKASYALKLLQSEGEISIASTSKDPVSGKMVTREYRVVGPVMIFLTTTSIELDEELENRCVVLSVDDGRLQTKAIHQAQREQETLSGLWSAEEKKRLMKLHKNAQRLLRPLAIVNPYARELTFLDDRARLRRDHKKYLVLIRAIALLRQYQKPLESSEYGGHRKEYIEVEPQDIELANRLAHETLGRSLDELMPQTRRMLGLVLRMVRHRCAEMGIKQGEVRFSRKEVRQFSGWTDFQVKMHMKKLEELEYVLVHRGGRGQSFVYELLYQGEGEDGRPFVMGLLDVRKLGGVGRGYDGKLEHFFKDKEILEQKKEPPSSREGAAKETGSRWPKNVETLDGGKAQGGFGLEECKNAVLGKHEEAGPSYVHVGRNGKGALAVEG